jgi:hypothetical protein
MATFHWGRRRESRWQGQDDVADEAEFARSTELTDLRRGTDLRERAWGAVASIAAAPPSLLALSLGLGAFLRLWQLNALGYNSDEAVYAGQAAGFVNDPDLTKFFPIIRAHPMLFQFILALVFHFGVNDLAGRVTSVVIGLLTVVLVYETGKVLYGEWVGAVAALFMSLMPYHVVVTRQVLLDGPMTCCATLTLYALARFSTTGRPAWLYATGASLGMTFLSKETGFILIGAIYIFLAISAEIRVRLRDLIGSGVVMMAIVISFPMSLKLAGGGASSKAQGYLVWQLLRRPNHTWEFYPTTVPWAVGPLVIATAVLGIWLLRRERSWRERLLLAWILVPVGFFQMWPVKGFQYLLPAAPAVAILSARMLVRWAPRWRRSFGRRHWGYVLRPLAVAAVALTLFLPSWDRVQTVNADQFLAGSGGVPGGREAGEWINAHVPEGAVFLTVGPSMANIVQFYGRRQAYGVCVSPNPLKRNPSYQAIVNPDQKIRTGELQYLVFDSFSAARSPFFGKALLKYAERYHGVIVHTEYVTLKGPDGTLKQKPVIVIYQVRP